MLWVRNYIELHAMASWLGTPQVAEELGLTPRTVYGLVNRGELVAHRFGRVIRVRRADLDDFLDRSRVEPGSLDHLNQTR